MQVGCICRDLRGLSDVCDGPLLSEEGTSQQGLRTSSESQGQILALIVLHVPYSLESWVSSVSLENNHLMPKVTKSRHLSQRRHFSSRPVHFRECFNVDAWPTDATGALQGYLAHKKPPTPLGPP